MKFSIAVLITLTLVTVTAVGQNLTPIVDLNSPVDAAANASASLSMDAPDRAVDGQGDRYYQMQVLQEEVQMLRGMVEELNYELQQLKQRQMDDYLDIDRRLSAQVSGSAVERPLPLGCRQRPLPEVLVGSQLCPRPTGPRMGW